MAKQSEMAGNDYRKAVAEFRKSIGINAEIYTSLNNYANDKLFTASIYSRGILGERDFAVTADTFQELFEALTNKWSDFSEQHKAAVIRKMALAIIRITAELGECTDAALRNCGEFDHGQINAYGEQACADANEIAGKGPFSIVVMGGANAETEAA